jgi:hypothetical protein
MFFAKRILCLLFSFAFGFILLNEPARTEGRKLALVIGNSEYRHSPRLDNPANDANDLAETFAAVGFEVRKGLDLDKTGMDALIREFAEALTGASAGLFFYAGHGLQVSGQNYLVPVDAKLTSAAAIDFELIRLDLIHRTMEREAKTNIIILDACRNNPLQRNLSRALGTRSIEIGRGLASVESGEGTLISYSTQPGNVALDGEAGRNSPFAKALLAHIGTQGDDLQTILISVRNDVMAATDRRQVPWEHSAMTARFFFSEPQASVDQEAEIALWNSVKDTTDPAVVRRYLLKYPQGAFPVVARNLIMALDQQREMARAAQQNEKAFSEALRKAEEDLRKAQAAAKSPPARQKTAQPTAANPQQPKPNIGGYTTCGRNGCQFVPPGCHTIRKGGGGGLGGKIVCP